MVARDLPGDDPSIEWASPWAGALIVLGGVSSSRDRKMQLRSFSELWKLSFQYPGPESGIRRIVLEDIFDDDRTESDIWWQKFMPEVSRMLYCVCIRNSMLISIFIFFSFSFFLLTNYLLVRPSE